MARAIAVSNTPVINLGRGDDQGPLDYTMQAFNSLMARNQEREAGTVRQFEQRLEQYKGRPDIQEKLAKDYIAKNPSAKRYLSAYLTEMPLTGEAALGKQRDDLLGPMLTKLGEQLQGGGAIDPNVMSIFYNRLTGGDKSMEPHQFAAMLQRFYSDPAVAEKTPERFKKYLDIEAKIAPTGTDVMKNETDIRGQDVTATTLRRGQDLDLTGTKYTADRSLEGSKYGTDAQAPVRASQVDLNKANTNKVATETANIPQTRAIKEIEDSPVVQAAKMKLQELVQQRNAFMATARADTNDKSRAAAQARADEINAKIDMVQDRLTRLRTTAENMQGVVAGAQRGAVPQQGPPSPTPPRPQPVPAPAPRPAPAAPAPATAAPARQPGAPPAARSPEQLKAMISQIPGIDPANKTLTAMAAEQLKEMGVDTSGWRIVQ